MNFGFNTGSNWLDRYYEAYWAVIEAYYKRLGVVSGYDFYQEAFKKSLLPAIEASVQSTKGIYANAYWSKYYDDIYKSYFLDNSLDQIFADYDITGVDVAAILKKWGFGDQAGAGNANGSVDLLVPKRFARNAVDLITNFDPRQQRLRLDGADWGIGSKPSLAITRQSKRVREFAASDADFVYDQSKGLLYFNENGSAHGFGEGGLCAVLKGSPLLDEKVFQLT